MITAGASEIKLHTKSMITALKQTDSNFSGCELREEFCEEAEVCDDIDFCDNTNICDKTESFLHKQKLY